jgi:hypothetical protein
VHSPARQFTYGFGNINHRHLIFGFKGSIFWFFRDEWPQLVNVNSWAMIPVSLLMEHSHTALTIEPWMAKKMKIILMRNTLLIINCELTIYSSKFSRGAYHQLYLYHLGAFCAFQFFRDPLRHNLSCVSSSLIWRPKIREKNMMRYKEIQPLLRLMCATLTISLR